MRKAISLVLALISRVDNDNGCNDADTVSRRALGNDVDAKVRSRQRYRCGNGNQQGRHHSQQRATHSGDIAQPESGRHSAAAELREYRACSVSYT